MSELVTRQNNNELLSTRNNEESISQPIIQITGITIYTPNQIQVSGELDYGYASRVSMSTISPANYERELLVWSELEKNKAELEKLKEEGVISEADAFEILSQHALFLERMDEVAKHDGKVVVMCGGDLFVGDTLNDAVLKARAKHGDRVYYSETVNLIDIPSMFPTNADRVST